MDRRGAVKVLVAAVLAGGTLIACERGDADAEYSDPSVPIRVSVNDSPVLALESNPSTGFSWSLARPLDESILRLDGSRYVPGGRSTPGSGGVEYWTFTAVGRGSTTILMRYARPSQDEGARTSEFRVEVYSTAL